MYSGTQITVFILLIIGSIIGLCFVFFTRQTKNFFISILGKYKKRYVVCHMIYQNGMEDVYNVVPNPEGLTQVGKLSYMLIDKYVTLYHKKRAHFVLDENDTIPRHFERQTNESIIFQASEIQTALNNEVMAFLFSKKKDVMMIIVCFLVILSIAVMAYTIYEINSLMSMAAQYSSIVQVKQ
jgi:hypothetical protein